MMPNFQIVDIIIMVGLESSPTNDQPLSRSQYTFKLYISVKYIFKIHTHMFKRKKLNFLYILRLCYFYSVDL